MFYVGHFSFETPEPEYKTEGRERGWFTLLAEAESVEDAVDTFREFVGSLKTWFTSLENVEYVYLDDVTEVESVPREGVLAQFVHTYDNPPSWIATTLRGVSEEFCRSYGWGPEEPDEVDGGVEAKPFVSFEEGQRCRRLA